MMREYHVRICEGLGVKFPGSTRPQYPSIAAVLTRSWVAAAVGQ
jgi:hypothetical protein